MEKHQYPASGRASQSLTLAGRAYPAVTVISPCDLDLLSSFLPRDWLASNSSAVPLSDAGFQASFGIVPRGVFRRAEQTLSSMSFAPATSADVHMNERTPVSPVFVQPKNSARRGANSAPGLYGKDRFEESPQKPWSPNQSALRCAHPVGAQTALSHLHAHPTSAPLHGKGPGAVAAASRP